ncbi:MAG TPA: AsmA family protein, partial [Caldimonas sp.]|nr:AsmA family protein [Caldimonas sp.]
MSGLRMARRGLAIVAALVLVVVLALLLQPWWLAPLMSHRLSASAQRPVRFDSMWVTLTGALQPAVHFRGVRIDNAPWADASRPFAALESATAVFSWLSLRERRPVIALLVLRDGQIDLERRADGLRNWRLSHPDDRGPGRFKVLSIRGENATLRLLHERLELDLEAKATPDSGSAARAAASDGTTDAEAMPTRLAIRGTWRGVPFAVDAATSDVLTFAETGRAFRARGQATSGGARLDFDGHLGDIVRDPIVDARVSVAAPSLVPFAALLGARRPEAKGIAASGELKGSPGRYVLSVARGRLGATDLAGELSWTRGDERNVVGAKLTSESTSLADLRALAGRHVAQAGERGRGEPSDAPPGRPVDVELGFAARRLHGEGLPWLRGGRIDAAYSAGKLTVSRFDVGVGDGRASGKASVDTTSTPLRGDAELDVSGIEIESLLPAKAANSLLSGTLHGHAALKASGDSPAALLASAAGTVSAFVSGGTISTLLDAKMGLQVGRALRSLLTGAEPMPVRCAALVLD